ncbi:MAG: glycine--tRNA ligase subunit beta [Rickettsiales bacterium]|nr:glycine--tRNA ligase subunit beta [Rickettsiales bacterium]
MANLLLELFSEELPAGMQPKAESWLRENLLKALKAAKLEYGDVATFRTPRRLALIVNDLPERQPDVAEERKGPATSAPDQALEGFLRSTGLSKDKLEMREIKGKEYFFAVINEEGKATADALKSIIEKLLSDLPWAKSMRWGDYSLNWARPLQNICCILGNEIVPIEFAHLKANNLTYGHRFHAPAEIMLTASADYEASLEKAYVIADGVKREAVIKDAIEKQATASALSVVDDSALLLEVTGLVEWPVVLEGSIDDCFMDLPPEVMRSEMRNHQKYFTLLEKDGTAASKFLITSNIEASDGGKAVIAGNERVLRARLADGQFFYRKDQKQPLAQWNEKLKSVVFHAKLGTVADKVERIGKTATALCEFIPSADKAKVARAAKLCKSDLATGMVGEFADLQGTMGRYYALAQNEDPQVADAISEHYLPQGPKSPVPTQPTSIAVALADKLDTLTGLFGADEIPTGSKDPFALRRAALGVIRIILENKLRLPLSQFTGNDKTLHAFFFERLRGVLKDKGLRHDVIEAVITNTQDDDFLRLTRKIEALQDFMQGQDASALLTAYGRAANILAKSDSSTQGNVIADLLEQIEEKTLFEAMNSTATAVEAHLTAEAYGEALTSFAELRQPVDAFFDKVTVNADNADLRQNRLTLLSALVDNMQNIADFSQIQQAA